MIRVCFIPSDLAIGPVNFILLRIGTLNVRKHWNHILFLGPYTDRNHPLVRRHSNAICRHFRRFSTLKWTFKGWFVLSKAQIRPNQVPNKYFKFHSIYILDLWWHMGTWVVNVPWLNCFPWQVWVVQSKERMMK